MRWSWFPGLLVFGALIAFRFTLMPGAASGYTPTPSPTLAPTPTPSLCSPSIASVSPPAGFVGSDITIEGACFGSAGSVTFGDVLLYVVQWSDSRIIAYMEPGVRPGTADLAVVNDSGMTARLSYTVHNYSLLGPHDVIVPGSIHVKVRPGADVQAVSLRHGGGSLEPLFPGSDDPVLSRWWQVSVPVGQEVEKVIEFAADADVEWAEVVRMFALIEPQPTPTPSAKKLPRTGGETTEADATRASWPAVGLGAAGLVLVLGSIAFCYRMRGR